MGESAGPIDVVFPEPGEAHSPRDLRPVPFSRGPATNPYQLRRPIPLQLTQGIEGGWYIAIVPSAEARHQQPLRAAEEPLPQPGAVFPADRGQRNVTPAGNHLNLFTNACPP